MLYFLAVIFPPVAVLLCGRPIAALLNVLLCFCFLIPGIIHACAIVGDSAANGRAKRLRKEMRQEMRKQNRE
jgi:uncharacterized membrane protein YqaE (UPF0057 family)